MAHNAHRDRLRRMRARTRPVKAFKKRSKTKSGQQAPGREKTKNNKPGTYSRPAPRWLVDKAVHGAMISYDADKASQVLDYASTSNLSITQILEIVGVPVHVWYRWLAADVDGGRLRERYAQARQCQARVRFDHLSDQNAKMEQVIADPERDATTKKLLLRLNDTAVRTQQWLIERGNPAEFMPQLHIDHHISVDAGELRERAWQARAADADVSDVDTIDGDTPQLPNTG